MKSSNYKSPSIRFYTSTVTQRPCWTYGNKHLVKSVRIRSYFDPYLVRMQENTDQNNSEYEQFLRSEK